MSYIVHSGNSYIADERGSCFVSGRRHAHIFRHAADADAVAKMWHEGGRELSVTSILLPPDPAARRSQKAAKVFLDLPPEAMPRARYANDEDSWHGESAWGTLRECARTGETCKSLCGTPIIVSSSRHAGGEQVID